MPGERIPFLPVFEATLNAPAEAFLGERLKVRAGYPDDAPPSLYTGAAMETSFNIQLVKSGNPPQTLGWQTQTTGAGADEIAIQITWPEGFWEVNDVGNDHGEAMLIQVRYAPTGTQSWTNRPDFHAHGPSRRTLTYTDRWAVPNGQYDVQVQVESFWHPALQPSGLNVLDAPHPDQYRGLFVGNETGVLSCPSLAFGVVLRARALACRRQRNAMPTAKRPPHSCERARVTHPLSHNIAIGRRRARRAPADCQRRSQCQRDCGDQRPLLTERHR